jgi:hypothetical protein
MTTKIPKFTKVLTIKLAAAKLKPVYHEAVLDERPLPSLKKGQVLVRIGAAAFNHTAHAPSYARLLVSNLVLASRFG